MTFFVRTDYTKTLFVKTFQKSKNTLTTYIPNKNQLALIQTECSPKLKDKLKANADKRTEKGENMNFQKRKKFYTSYSKLSEIKLLTIGIASPLRILQWAEKTLPNGKIYGEVLNANTLHHKTFKPQKGGLFCERIFGPLKDFECACGKVDKSVKKEFLNSKLLNSQSPSIKKNSKDATLVMDKADGLSESLGKGGFINSVDSSQNKEEMSGVARETKREKPNRKYCPDCDVEYTWSVIRRYQLGYIKLNSPVTHIWFLKGTPSYLSILLDIKKRHLQFVTYCSETLTVENSFAFDTQSNQQMVLDSPSQIFSSWQNIIRKTTSSKEKSNQQNNLQIEDMDITNKKDSHMQDKEIEKIELRKQDEQGVSVKKQPTYGKARKKATLPTPQKNWKRFLPIMDFSKQSVMSVNSRFNPTEPGRGALLALRESAGNPEEVLESYGQVDTNFNDSDKKLENLSAFQARALLKNPVKYEQFVRPFLLSDISLDSDKPSTSSSFSQFLPAVSQPSDLLEPALLASLAKRAPRFAKGHEDKRDSAHGDKRLHLESETGENKMTKKVKPISLTKKGGALLLCALQLSTYYNSLRLSKSVLANQKTLKHSILNNFPEKQKAKNLAARFFLDGKSQLDSLMDFNLKQNASLFKSKGLRFVPQRGKQSETPSGLSALVPLGGKGDSALGELTLTRESDLPGTPVDISRMQNSDLFSSNEASLVFQGQSSYMPYLNQISKKLPIDLYILSSLERMVHKSSLILSINKTWQEIYKRAYLKAMNKATRVFSKLCILEKLSTSSTLFGTPSGLLEKGSEEKTASLFTHDSFYFSHFFEEQRNADKLGSLYALLFPTKRKKAVSRNDENQRQDKIQKLFVNLYRKNKFEASKIGVKNANKFLLTIKKYFGNHVLLALRNLKSPILSVNYTTQLHNDLLKIEKEISADIVQYLSLNTEYIENLLAESLLKPLIVGKYFEYLSHLSVQKQTGINKSKDSSFESKKMSFLNEDFLSSKYNNVLNLYKNFVKLRKIQVYSSFSQPAYFYKHIRNSTEENKMSSFCSFATTSKILKKGVYNDGYLRFSVNPRLCPLAKREARPFAKRGASEAREIPNVQASYFAVKKYGTSLIKSNKTNETEYLQTKLRYPSSIPNTMTVRDIKDKPKKFEHKQKIYNNVYTLSHRERWGAEKDWQIFNLFNSGFNSVDSYNIDYPIYTYKNRLYSFYETTTSNFLETPMKTSAPMLLKEASIGNKSTFASVNAFSKTQVSQGFTTPLNYKLSSAFYSGAGIVQQLLNEFDYYEIKKLDKQNRLLLYQLNKYILKLKKHVQIFVYDKTVQLELRELCKKRDFLIRRTKLVRKMFRKNSNPTSMILTVIPVLPPDLRPIVKMGGQIAASDLNRLYQRVIYRNDRLKKFLKDPSTSHSYEMKYAQRLLQEAVDNLMQNGKSGLNSEKDARGRALKSLSDILKGKQGRFRQFLLGKRVDYSGRSVIVVGPKLKLHECGLPLEMAKELYLPFLLKSILNKNYAKTVVGAKTLIKNNPSLAYELLREIMQVSPVLLNRAPTLHRLGIQAFVPKLIEGRAILLHPLVCSAFNADFDGDQMAVHVPITVEARAEAWKLMLSRNNILSPATGEPLAIPSQDMVLGCYYLTTFSNHGNVLRGSGMYFNKLQDVLKAYEQDQIDIHALVWVKWTGLIENGNDQEEPVEIRLSRFGQWQEITSNYIRIYDSNNVLVSQYMATTPGRILFNSIIQRITINSDF